ncbi:MAG: DUF4349 domain-containing protein [Bacillota bacterium]
MNCQQARELLSLCVDGELPAAERADLEEHLDQCEECRCELAELQALVDALGALPEEPLPAGFGESLHDSLTRRSWRLALAPRLGRLLPGPVSFPPAWARALAVACLVVFLGSSLVTLAGLGRGWWTPAANPFLAPSLVSGDLGRASSPQWDQGAQDRVLTGTEVASSDRSAGLSQVTGPAVAPDVRPQSAGGGAWVAAGQVQGMQAALQGEMDLQVVDIDQAVSRLTSLAEEAAGYLQDSTVTSQDGRRQAVVVVRVPGGSLSGVMAKARDLGRVLGEKATTRSLTQDWVDAEARLRIMRVQEKALNDLLANARNIDEVLRIQYEVYRLQADIESLESRMKYLQEDQNMAALQVVLREAGMVATLGPWQRAQVAFLGTVQAMERLGQEAIVYVAQAFPVLLLGGLAWLVYARFGHGRWHR